MKSIEANISRAVQTRTELWIILIATFSVYFKTIWFPFVSLDDGTYVLNNDNLKNLSWQSVVYAITEMRYFYHPVTWISLMFDRLILGSMPAGYHFMNVIIHIGNVYLVYEIMCRLNHNRKMVNLVVTLLFALHPYNAETVCWVSERKGLLAAFFALASIYASIRMRPICRSRMDYSTLILFTLSMLSKPVYAFLPVLIYNIRDLVFDENGVERKSFGAKAWEFVSYTWLAWLVGLVISVMCIVAAKNANTFYLPRSLDHVLANMPILVSYYLSCVICDFGFSPVVLESWLIENEYRLYLLASPIVLLSVIMITKRSTVLFGLLWFGVLIFPALGIVKTGHQIAAGRYGYLANVGLYAIIAGGFSIFKKEQFNTTCTVLLAIVLSIITIRYVNVWKSSSTLYLAMIERDKHNWLAFGNLGTEYAEKGDYTNALVNYKKALDIMPNEPLLIQNAVRLQYNNNNPVGAMNTMLHGKVIVLQPGNTVGH